MDEFLKRYTADEIKVIEEYWETIKWTRPSGKLSERIQSVEMQYWEKFDKKIVISALEIHIDNYPDRREHYTRGIMRNIASREKAKTDVKPDTSRQRKTTRKNKFCNYEPREWDYAEIERRELEMLHNEYGKG